MKNKIVVLSIVIREWWFYSYRSHCHFHFPWQKIANISKASWLHNKTEDTLYLSTFFPKSIWNYHNYRMKWFYPSDIGNPNPPFQSISSHTLSHSLFSSTPHACIFWGWGGTFQITVFQIVSDLEFSYKQGIIKKFPSQKEFHHHIS